MLIIRPAGLSDADSLFKLAKAFATSFSVERTDFESSFAALLQSEDAFLGAACEDEELVGYILGFAHRTFFANGRVAWVEEIMVAETMRRRGIGRELMKHFEQWAGNREAKLVALATRRAAAFYLSIGYSESASYFRKLLDGPKSE